GIGAAMIWRQTCLWASEKPAHARFTLARADGPVSLTSNCSANVYDAEVKHCAFGAAASPLSVVLIGDSHAAQWFDALEPIALKKGWQLLTMVKNGCAMVNASYFLPLLGRHYTECGEWRKSAIEKIRDIRPFLTVMSSQDGYLF